MNTLAKRQLSRLHRRGEGGREPRRQLFIRPKQSVPVADEIHRQAVRTGKKKTTTTGAALQ
jgi:hypothetical protein